MNSNKLCNQPIFLILILLVSSVFPPAADSSEKPLEKITLQLIWKHQFQFAGYYAAIEKGFYAAEGLDVQLKERDPGQNPIETVLAGDAQYGIADAGLLLFRAQGKPVVLLKQIFQHSPLVFLSKKESGIISPYEMAGKRVMSAFEGLSSQLTALLQDALGDLSHVQKIKHSMDYNDLVDDKVDVIAAYLTDQPFWFREKGIAINIINPQNYGIDFYGDNLFTTDQEINDHPQRVEKMIRASLKGWHYALAHPEEIITLILTKYKSEPSREALSFEAKMMELMILPDLIELGDVEPKRYESIAQIYYRLGQISQPQIPEGFFYGSRLKTIPLTRKEQDWLSAHPKIRMGFSDSLEPALIIEQSGSYSGILVDFLQQINQRLGTNITIVANAPDSLFNQIKENEIEGYLSLTPGHADFRGLLKTNPHFTAYPAIFTKSTASFPLTGLDDLNGKSVAIIKAEYFVEKLLEPHADKIKVLRFDTSLAAFQAVLDGTADAMLGWTFHNYIVTKYLLANIIPKKILWDKPARVVTGIRPDYPELVAILNKGIDSFTESERNAIVSKWTNISPPATVELTEQEKSWLTAHPVIRVGSDPDWYPIEFQNEKGEFQGLAVDYLKHVEKILGVHFEIASGFSWQALIERAKKRQIDMFSCANKTPERLKYLSFTEPYISFPTSIFTRNDAPFIGSMEELNSKEVAVVQDYAIHEELSRDFPHINFIPVASIPEGLTAMKNGKVYAFIGNLLTTGNYISKMGYVDLKVAGEAPYQNHLAMAVRSDWPELASILQKSLNTMSAVEKDRIYNKWISLTMEKQFDYTILWRLIAGALVLIAIVFYWNRRLAIAVNNRTKDLKMAEKNLRDALKLLQSSIDTMPIGYILWDNQFRVVEWNPAAEHIFGYARDEMIGRYIIDDIVPEHCRHLARESKEDLLKGKSIDYTEKDSNIRKDRTLISCRWHSVLLKDNSSKDIGILSMVEDISEQLKIEERRLLLETAVEQSVEHMVITDKHAHIQYVNPSFERVTGYSKAELIGQNPGILKSGKQDASFYRELWQAISSGKVWQGNMINKRKDGTLFEEEQTIAPIINKKGEIVNYIGIKRDITERLNLERQLAQAQKMEAIGTLAGGIAHDFNNILSAVFGYMQLAQMAVGNPEKQVKALDGINQAAKRAKDLVKQILIYSRKGGQEKRPLTLETLSKEVVQLIRQTIPSTITIESDISSTQTIIADPTQVHQVLMNLCTNSYHAMRKTGGTLRVSVFDLILESPEVKGDVIVPPGKYVIIEISDTGVGIDEDMLPKIFEPYTTTKDVGEGTGLGLSVVHGIIANHQGYIMVESKPGSGTTFKIYIPAFESRPEKIASEGFVEPDNLQSNKRVLFVDDEESLVDIACKAFPKYGYSISAFHDPSQALNEFLAEPGKYDLVITDMTMPKMTGIELTRALLAIRPDLPVFLCTGYSELITKEDAVKEGVNIFVEKPYTTTSLIEILNRYFRRNQ